MQKNYWINLDNYSPEVKKYIQDGVSKGILDQDIVSGTCDKLHE